MQLLRYPSLYLAHEVRDHAVEGAALEVQWLATATHPFLTCDQPLWGHETTVR